jgi:hypothetical protein
VPAAAKHGGSDKTLEPPAYLSYSHTIKYTFLFQKLGRLAKTQREKEEEKKKLLISENTPVSRERDGELPNQQI